MKTATRPPRKLLAAFAIVALASGVINGQQPAAPTGGAPTFSSSVKLVLVDVAVHDRKGDVVKGLTASDFELVEDGRKQDIQSFAFEEVAVKANGIESAAMFSSAASNATPVAAGGVPINVAPAAAANAPAAPLTQEDAAGHRLMTLLFDTSSMQPEDVQKAVDSAEKWVNEDMTSADLVAVASIGSSLQVLNDFTNSKDTVLQTLAAFSGANGTAFDAVDASTAATDDTNNTSSDDTTAVDASAQELDTFNNDVRLRAIKTLADALAPLQQKKAILYFSSGMQRSGTDNQIELRAATNAAIRANVQIYPIDSRGLQAVVPGGDARQGSRGGRGAFSGQQVQQQFTQLQAQQETLTTLAADTGGTAFTDSNDFGEAFAKVEKDISSYYILGFASTNPAKDGRFRRITIRLKNSKLDAKVEAREGYYADRDFTHTAKEDREVQLQEQLMTQIPATDVPLFVTAGWFRLAADRYFVPVSVAVPGSAVPPSKDKVTLDIRGYIRDERGAPVGQIKDTMTVPPAATGDLAARQVLYQTGVTLPPGRFSVKLVVRENTTGQMGTFETPITVPELKQAPVKVSSLVLSTQLQDVGAKKTASPLVKDGVEVVPNLTHIVSRSQKLYFYYEVYDPAMDSGAPLVRTSLAFYRGKVKIYETPVVERSAVDATDRKADIFQFEVPAENFKPGLYTCQVNIVDEVAGKFAFPRLEMYVRN
ncbi:MAG TPA: VWA domain-containing protein [Vicinamibacterales bacterium]|jgi:VWFA-related protein|nr:VWA domain-containing protein [Vicinamibacterales bacterium]